MPSGRAQPATHLNTFDQSHALPVQHNWAGQCNVYPAFSGSFYTFTLFLPYLQFSIFLIYVKRSLAFLILLKTVYNGWFPFHHALIIVIGTENTYFQYENIY